MQVIILPSLKSIVHIQQ